MGNILVLGHRISYKYKYSREMVVDLFCYINNTIAEQVRTFLGTLRGSFAIPKCKVQLLEV